MGKIREMLRFFDRRRRSEPVVVERRHTKPSLKSSREHLRTALREFDSAARRLTGEKREVANDIQQTVKFSTFREICTFRVPQVQVRLCRHPKHDAANTGTAACDEQLCPIMRGAA